MSVQRSEASRGAARRSRRARRVTWVVLALLAPLAAAAARASLPAPGSPGASTRLPGRGPVVEGGDLRVLQGRQVSMDEAIEMAQRRFNARVVRAEVAEREGRKVYVLRLLSADGRVFNVRVDAATGSMQ